MEETMVMYFSVFDVVVWVLAVVVIFAAGIFLGYRIAKNRKANSPA